MTQHRPSTQGGQGLELAQSKMLALAFTRAGERWELAALHGGSVDLAEIDLTVPLADVHAGVLFDDVTPEA